MTKILFICTHNRCRSVLSEAIANQRGTGVIRAASAGSAPAGAIHPMTLTMLERRGYPTDGLYSKSWDSLAAFAPDVVVTVCDSAANESCPVWMGPVKKLHWSLPDPSKLEDPSEQEAAFNAVIDTIEARIDAWVADRTELLSPTTGAP